MKIPAFLCPENMLVIKKGTWSSGQCSLYVKGLFVRRLNGFFFIGPLFLFSVVDGFGAIKKAQYVYWALKIRETGIEPARIAPPEPKSGASANFATHAACSKYADL
jgi:hypothetical protein